MGIASAEDNGRFLRRKHISRWIFNMAVVNLVELSSESARGLTLPTLYLYVMRMGGGVADLSILISIFSVGRLFGSTVFGKLVDVTSARQTFAVSLVVSLIGNAMYVLADNASGGNIFGFTYGMMLLLISRFVVGFGAGNRAVCRANVADLTSQSSRMRYMTILQATVYFGYAVTPGVASVLPYQRNVEFTSTAFFRLNIYTLPGIVLCVLNAFVLASVALGYDESVDWTHEPIGEPSSSSSSSSLPPPPSALAATAAVSVISSDYMKTAGAIGTKQGDAVARSSSKRLSDELATKGFYLYLSLNFLLKGTLSIFETITPVLYLRVTDQTEEARNPTPRGQQIARFLFWLGVGGLAVLLVVAYQKSNRRLSDTLCWASLTLQGFGCAYGAICETYPSMRSLVATEILVWSIASPIAGAVIISSFSCILGPSKQGLSMGLIGSAGSLGRIIAPPINGALMSVNAGSSVFVVCSIASFVSAFSLYWFNAKARAEKQQDETEPLMGGLRRSNGV